MAPFYGNGILAAGGARRHYNATTGYLRLSARAGPHERGTGTTDTPGIDQC